MAQSQMGQSSWNRWLGRLFVLAALAGTTFPTAQAAALPKPTITRAKLNGDNTSGTYTQNTLTFSAKQALQYKIQAQTTAGAPLVDLVAATGLPDPDAKGLYTIRPVDISAVVEVKGKRTLYVSVLGHGSSSPAAKVSITMVTPKMSSLTPSGGQFIGDPVTIKGSGFGPGGLAEGTVTCQGAPASIVSWNETTIVFTVPPGATSGEVRVTSAEMPGFAAKTYAIYPTPVGAWDGIGKLSATQQVSLRFFIVKEGGRYFYLEGDESIGELTPGSNGKMSGKVCWVEQYDTDWDALAGVAVARCEVEEVNLWSLSFDKAEAGKPATFAATVKWSGGKATATAQRDDAIDPADWTWPLYQVEVECEANLPHQDEQGDVGVLVLVRKQAGVADAAEAVLMSVAGGQDLLLGQPEGLPEDLPFTVWQGSMEGVGLDLSGGGEVLLAGRESDLVVPLPALPNPPLITGVRPAVGSVVPLGAMDVAFTHTGEIPAGTFFNLWVTDEDADADVFSSDQVQVQAGSVGCTIPAGVLKNGKLYSFGIDIKPAGTTLNQASLGFEFESNLMAASTALDSRYSVYYTKSVSSGASILGSWEDLEGAKWMPLGANLAGVRTVTIPAGATAMKIQTNGRTLLDAVLRQDAGELWFETYWEDYWDRIAYDEAADLDLRTVDGKCWYLLGRKTYVASRFQEWSGSGHGPLLRPTAITITPR